MGVLMPIWPASTLRSNLRAVAPDWVKMAAPLPSASSAPKNEECESMRQQDTRGEQEETNSGSC